MIFLFLYLLWRAMYVFKKGAQLNGAGANSVCVCIYDAKTEYFRLEMKDCLPETQ